MKETKAKRNDRVKRGTVDFSTVGKGHQPHKSGAGTHKHRASGRNHTRSQQRTAALTGW